MNVENERKTFMVMRICFFQKVWFGRMEDSWEGDLADSEVECGQGKEGGGQQGGHPRRLLLHNMLRHRPPHLLRTLPLNHFLTNLLLLLPPTLAAIRVGRQPDQTLRVLGGIHAPLHSQVTGTLGLSN